MNTCNQTTQVHRYHDGQMNAQDAQAYEHHLQACPVCQAELASLREMSSLFAEASLPELSELSRARLHQAVDQRMNLAQERGVLRLAQWLSAAAAAVLVVCSVQLAFMNSTASADTSPTLAWEMTTAMLTQDNTAGGIVSDEHSLAAWIVDDLSADGQQRAANTSSRGE